MGNALLTKASSSGGSSVFSKVSVYHFEELPEVAVRTSGEWTTAEYPLTDSKTLHDILDPTQPPPAIQIIIDIDVNSNGQNTSIGLDSHQLYDNEFEYCVFSTVYTIGSYQHIYCNILMIRAFTTSTAGTDGSELCYTAITDTYGTTVEAFTTFAPKINVNSGTSRVYRKNLSIDIYAIY